MEGGLTWIAWAPSLVLLGVSSGLAFAYNRLRGRSMEAEGRGSGYMQVFEQAYDGLFVIDFVSGAIHRANERAAGMLGYGREELATKTIFDLHFQQDLERSATRIADAWSAGGLVYDDIPFRTAAGEELPVECSTRVTAFEGKPAIILYARDITERLRLQNEVAEKNAVVERQNEEMQSSLRYAQGIQMGMLPPLGQLRSSFSDAFVLFRPRDVVSGDFYWSGRVGSKVIVAVADCTGHGVPGALLSMTGIALLQQTVVGRGMTAPASILHELRAELLRTLVHSEGDKRIRDGMNIGLFAYDPVTEECEFSGALCPLYIVRAGSGLLEEIKGDRMPVGYHDGEPRAFTGHLFELRKGDRLFMATDGFADQFGGLHGRKLKTSGLKELLTSTSPMRVPDQARALDHAFTDWMNTLEQVDDVTLLGVVI